MSLRRFLSISIAILPLASLQAADSVQFNRDIRPILNSQCFKCHGGVKEAGGLNLQFREQAVKAGETGEIAIVPGKPEESAFIERLTTDDVTDRMPKKQPPLPKEQVELLKKWIAQGASWEDHWAYVQPRGAGKGIDEIVEARLQRENLQLSPQADRIVLARRSSLDLTGLPPSPDEADVFVKDQAPDAYERWVDQLLASPAYGERWAVPWLDLARYADSKGYESDRFRDMWRYRDWVIDALNEDMPYDRFVTEQLAGDLLPNPTDDQIVATAFHRNTPQNDEGGTDDEEFRTYAVLDRVNTTFDALQGTSIGCVQCHGHPYDPFVHKEYYQLVAFFNNTADADRDDQAPTRKFRSRKDEKTAADLERQIAETQRQIDDRQSQPANRDALNQWLAKLRPVQESAVLNPSVVSSTHGLYRKGEHGLVIADEPYPDRTTITVEAPITAGPLAAVVLHVEPNERLPKKGPGTNGGVGNFILTKFEAALSVPGMAVDRPLDFTRARATFEQPSWPVAEAIKTGAGPTNEGEGGWAIAGGTGRAQTATFSLADSVIVPSGARVRITLQCENERWSQHLIGSFRLGVLAEDSTQSALAGVPADLRGLVSGDPAKWKPEERTRIVRHFFTVVQPELVDLYRQVDEGKKSLEAIPVCSLPIMKELTGSAARKTQVFHRGNWLDKAEEVQPATPQALNTWPADYPRNRLGFARWLTNSENPLAARVQVNRVWEQLFGVGLVETLEDFGTQGDRPIYQDLLDELAARFQTDLKWSQKKLIREIVLSKVYRQSSRANAEQLNRDPANRLLARGPRFRLTSEEIRDQALAVGGILSRKMYGVPVMPYQPAGTWLVPYEGRDWTTSAGEDSHRRALYTFIRRSATYPSSITFDAPNREYCMVRRIRTNTPLQSLDLLNSPVFMEAAAALAKRMQTEAGADLDQQLAHGFLLATLRTPKPNEVAILRNLHGRVKGNMTLVANSILNLDEVLTKN